MSQTEKSGRDIGVELEPDEEERLDPEEAKRRAREYWTALARRPKTAGDSSRARRRPRWDYGW